MDVGGRGLPHLKGNLGLRPIDHHKPKRIEAHLLVAFLGYGLSISRSIMPRVVLETGHAELLDVRVPTTDGRELLLVPTPNRVGPSRCCWFG
jgi:hypothetical protein